MNKKRWGLVGLIGLLVIVLVLMITGWQPNQKRQQRPIRVVTSLNFYGEVARTVAGKYGEVQSFINSGSVDTHDFQPSTKQARQLSHANVVIENGLGYDEWVNKMVHAADGHQRVINVGQDVARKKPGDNEHVWYEPTTMSRLAQQLAKQYSKIDPSHRHYYHQQAKRYQKQLAKLNATIERAKRNAQAGNREVLVSEPVFDYALRNMGYKIQNERFAKAVEDGNDPSPQEITQIQSAIRNHEVAFVVNNKQESNSTVRNMVKLARQHDIPVLNVTETKPAHQTYVEWMQSEYDSLIQIQERSK